MIGGACGRQDNVCEEGQIISMHSNCQWKLFQWIKPTRVFLVQAVQLGTSTLSIMWIGLYAFTGNMPFIWGSWYFDGIEGFTKKTWKWMTLRIRAIKETFSWVLTQSQIWWPQLTWWYRILQSHNSFISVHRGGMLCVKQPWVTPFSPLMFSWSQL